MNAARGEIAVHRAPAMLLAARLPKAWMAASRPNADPGRFRRLAYRQDARGC